MRIILAIAAFFAAAGGVYAYSLHPTPSHTPEVWIAPDGIDPIITSGIAHDFSMTANGGAASCAVSRGGDIGKGIAELTVGAGCDAVLPGIETAKFWREADDGSIGFSADGVRDLVSFGLADGADYESFAPRAPFITLAAR